jgi:hypothetical protein
VPWTARHDWAVLPVLPVLPSANLLTCLAWRSWIAARSAEGEAVHQFALGHDQALFDALAGPAPDGILMLSGDNAL